MRVAAVKCEISLVYALIRNERNRRNELVEEPEQHTVNTSEEEKKRIDERSSSDELPDEKEEEKYTRRERYRMMGREMRK